MKIKVAKTEFDIHQNLAQRWSPRVFMDQQLSDKEIHQLFEAARWAASSNNGQPWRFVYAQKDDDGYDTLFDCLGDFNKKWVVNAPFLMLTAYKKKFDNGKENFHALHDLGLAMGNFSMQAQELGLGVHQMAGLDWKKAHEVLDVPDGYHVTTAVAVGHYGGDISKLPEDLQEKERAERSRKSLDAIVAQGNWNFKE